MTRNGLGAPASSAPFNAHSAAKILVLGDSLSAEYGLPRGSGWVALLQAQLDRERIAASIVNASVSGETTAGGLSRLPALLREQRPSHVVIELGANDALRGLSLPHSEQNLRRMIAQCQEAHAKVLLVGMQMPPNWGADYTREFAAIYTRVQSSTHVRLVPFLLKGVADRPDALDWFQADRIHPQAKAQPVMLTNVWRVLKPMLLKPAS